MVKCAIIKDGAVINVAEATPEFAAKNGWVIADKANIGDSFDGKDFAPAIISVPTPAPTLKDLLVSKKIITAEEADTVK